MSGAVLRILLPWRAAPHRHRPFPPRPSGPVGVSRKPASSPGRPPRSLPPAASSTRLRLGPRPGPRPGPGVLRPRPPVPAPAAPTVAVPARVSCRRASCSPPGVLSRAPGGRGGRRWGAEKAGGGPGRSREGSARAAWASALFIYLFPRGGPCAGPVAERGGKRLGTWRTAVQSPGAPQGAEDRRGGPARGPEATLFDRGRDTLPYGRLVVGGLLQPVGVGQQETDSLLGFSRSTYLIITFRTPDSGVPL